MNKKISIKEAFSIWKTHSDSDMGSEHLSDRRLYQLALDGGLSKAKEWEVEHLSLCPHCLDKWEAFSVVTSPLPPEDYDAGGIISYGELKAAASGFKEPVSAQSTCRRFMFEILPDMDDPAKGMAVLEIIGDTPEEYEGKLVIIKDACNHTILKNIIRQGRAASRIERLDALDPSQWTIVIKMPADRE